eukprot:CAMPEP_0195625882 /NCGR_PEP_ID=MMETSP0815-20121206/18085_1 /TAXON_ID=97485 /ORGANISM="Prymnesium parvum, Strain Texoma1" /LENGTH=163 /DNA_ID=CAMNT_0040766979 /DNA_START=395 /DNA_END=883 /DNA_ORIENTATION=-
MAYFLAVLIITVATSSACFASPTLTCSSQKKHNDNQDGNFPCFNFALAFQKVFRIPVKDDSGKRLTGFLYITAIFDVGKGPFDYRRRIVECGVRPMCSFEIESKRQDGQQPLHLNFFSCCELEEVRMYVQSWNPVAPSCAHARAPPSCTTAGPPCRSRTSGLP